MRDSAKVEEDRRQDGLLLPVLPTLNNTTGNYPEVSRPGDPTPPERFSVSGVVIEKRNRECPELHPALLQPPGRAGHLAVVATYRCADTRSMTDPPRTNPLQERLRRR